MVAFAVAAASLVVQGGTLATVVTWVKPRAGDEAAENEEREQILALLMSIDAEVRGSRESSRTVALDVISAQRAALLGARDDGSFDAETLASALANLDADQIRLELRGGD